LDYSGATAQSYDKSKPASLKTRLTEINPRQYLSNPGLAINTLFVLGDCLFYSFG
jgi:hypothetical protein